MYGLHLNYSYMVGGIYRDFPENTRVKNAIYLAIPKDEMMNDWNTGPYYCYLLMKSPETAASSVEAYANENKVFLKGFSIDDIRERPLTALYFGKQVRGDAAPTGNKMRTDMLFFVAMLIIGIALVNYVNLSIALAPIRTKSITTQKVLGCTQAKLRRDLVLESLFISILAFAFSLVFILIFQHTEWITVMLGHPLNLYANGMIILWTLLIIVGTGIIAGIYPAFYITSPRLQPLTDHLL